MKGMELSRRYYTDIVLPAFEKEVPDILDQLAFGLVGPGSECRGYDDSVSRDHDWGPRVCVWVPENVFVSRGEELRKIYGILCGTYLGFGPVRQLEQGFRKDGVLSIERFFTALLGTAEQPESLRDWLLIPEEALSDCTNGEVFQDGPGIFSAMRDALLAYYPRDIQLKKISSRCRSAGRNGQHDLWRALARDDRAAVLHLKAAFAFDAAVLIHLLFRRFRPYGKWIYRSLSDISRSGQALSSCLAELDRAWGAGEIGEIVAACARILSSELDSLTGCAGDPDRPLYDRGGDIEKMIEDRELRDGYGLIL
jgi:hypothetical protein